MVAPTVSILLSLLMMSCARNGAREAIEEKQRGEPAAAVAAQLSADHSADLLSALQQLRQGATAAYQTPTIDELNAFGDWFTALAHAAREQRLPASPAPDGFHGSLAGDGRSWLLAESEERKRGAGAFLLRPGRGEEVVVQAPHTFFDQGTLHLSIALYEELQARALMINTVHRSGSGDREQRRQRALAANAESDLAHSDGSYYQHAHRALCQLLPKATTIQLHGYRDERAPDAQFIVSAANTQADPRPVARALNAEFDAPVARVYPDEVKLLGGTRNAQARASVAEGCGLIHLEIAGSVRGRLKKEADFRQRVARAIGRGLARR